MLLNRNKSTISREIHYNSSGEYYSPIQAQAKYTERHQACKPHLHLDNPQLMETVKRLRLKQQWSPEGIAARLNMEHHCKIISYNTIYRAIYSGQLNNGKKRSVVRKLRHQRIFP